MLFNVVYLLVRNASILSGLGFYDFGPAVARSVGASPATRSGTGMASAMRLPRFPEFGLLSVQKLLQLFPSLEPATWKNFIWPFYMFFQCHGVFTPAFWDMEDETVFFQLEKCP